MEAETPERGLARAGGEVPGVASRPLTPAPDAVFARALEELRGCRVCAAHLPLGPRPVARISPTAPILIVCYPPVTQVHATALPFYDPTADLLLGCLSVVRYTFYFARPIPFLPPPLFFPFPPPSFSHL